MCVVVSFKENGVPGVKHHTSNIHHLLQVVEIKLVSTCGISKLISFFFILIFICFLHALYRLNSLEQHFANYAYALFSTICMHIFRGSLIYIMWESNFVNYSFLHTKDHKVWPSLVLLMSSFSVFDSKGGEFRGPKARMNL